MKIVKRVSIVLVASVILYTAFSLPRLIKIRKVTCSSQFGPCNQNVTSEIEKLTDMNLADSRKKAKRFFSENVLVKEYLLQFSFPDELRVYILEKKPIYGLRSKGETGVLLIDKEGSAVAFQPDSNLPSIVASDGLPSVGEKVTDETLFALEITYDVSSFYQLLVAEIERSGLTVKLENGLEIIFPLKGDRQALLGSLSLILSRLNSESEEFRIEGVQRVNMIDLRFKNPVLK